jgi:hypothetical protein
MSKAPKADPAEGYRLLAGSVPNLQRRLRSKDTTIIYRLITVAQSSIPGFTGSVAILQSEENGSLIAVDVLRIINGEFPEVAA